MPLIDQLIPDNYFVSGLRKRMFTEANGSHVSKHEKGEAGANPAVLAMEVVSIYTCTYK